MEERHDEYRRACLNAVEYQLGFQLPDGGYIWEGYVKRFFTVMRRLAPQNPYEYFLAL